MLGLVALASTRGEAEALPLRLQAVLMEKILLFDRSLPKGQPQMVVLIYGEESDQAEQIHRALAELGVRSTMVNAGDLRRAPDAQLVYIFPRGLTPAVREWTMQRHALSFTGDTDPVKSGQVAVALTLEARKPHIMVNLTVVKAQGHDLSSGLLQVATVTH